LAARLQELQKVKTIANSVQPSEIIDKSEGNVTDRLKNAKKTGEILSDPARFFPFYPIEGENERKSLLKVSSLMISSLARMPLNHPTQKVIRRA
jgi:hypothetical protein